MVGITGTLLSPPTLKTNNQEAVAERGGTIRKFRDCGFRLKESSTMRYEKGQPVSDLMTSADDVAQEG